MKPLRFALLGTGFWSRFQLAAWGELPGVECAALYNRTRSRAEALARSMGLTATVHQDVDELLRRERIDFLDVVTDVDTHPQFVALAARHGLPVICQKPLAPTFAQARQMVRMCAEANVPLFVHENFRWQTPIRQVARLVREGAIGRPFRARIDFISGFPVFENQPFLKDLRQFIITDLGSHTLDVARFLFGEMESVYCRTARIHPEIAGEDVATIALQSAADATIVVQMAYAGTPLEHERFPETQLFVEGTQGSLTLGPDHWIRVTTREGTLCRRYPPPHFSWADPAYDLVHASIVPCNANLLAALRGQAPAETTGADNLETARLVFAAYEAASTGAVVSLRGDKGFGNER